MQVIDLTTFIATYKLDEKEVAKLLFPTHTHPKRALDRVLTGKSSLDAPQISRLASLVGVPPGLLFNPEGWVFKSKDEVHKFHTGDFTAELNVNTWITKIFHKDSLFHESVLSSKNIPLSEYINFLNITIKNYEHE